MKIWLLRSVADIPDGVYESIMERRPEDAIVYTKLYVCYDKPVNNHFMEVRTMCEVPNYMFPDIKEGECYEFESSLKIKL